MPSILKIPAPPLANAALAAAAVLALGFGARVLAYDAGGMMFEAQRDPGGIVSNFLWFGALCAAFIGLGLMTALSRTSSFGLSAKNLFLSLKMQLGSSAQEVTAHLHSIDLRHATIVSDARFERGARVRLDLASLPDYPKDGVDHGGGAPNWVDAEVVAVRALGGHPVSYLTRVKLPQLSENARRPLVTYVQTLAHHGRWAHA